MQDSADLVEVTQKRFRCRHIHAAGHQCGSPALRHEQFCYYHHTTRRPAPPPDKCRHIDKHEPFLLQLIEDRASALVVASHLLSRIASNDLDIDRAGKMLYNLQIITTLLPPEPGSNTSTAESGPEPTPKPPLVEELIHDEALGTIAPITEFFPPKSKSPHDQQPGILPTLIAAALPPSLVLNLNANRRAEVLPQSSTLRGWVAAATIEVPATHNRRYGYPTISAACCGYPQASVGPPVHIPLTLSDLSSRGYDDLTAARRQI